MHISGVGQEQCFTVSSCGSRHWRRRKTGRWDLEGCTYCAGDISWVSLAARTCALKRWREWHSVILFLYTQPAQMGVFYCSFIRGLLTLFHWKSLLLQWQLMAGQSTYLNLCCLFYSSSPNTAATGRGTVWAHLESIREPKVLNKGLVINRANHSLIPKILCSFLP